jgi:phosphoglycerol transferase MdoB-like AlkP superfamily enzyme
MFKLRFAPPRYAVLIWVAGLCIAISTATRCGLLAFEGDPANLEPWRAVPIFAVGLLYDLVATTYVLVPFALVALYAPGGSRGRKAHAWIASVLLAALLFLLLCTAVAEALFWNEFGTRFNFIAVDYLIYTREALGNIQESYPVTILFAAAAAAAVTLFLPICRRVFRAAEGPAGSFSRRLGVSSAILLLPVLSFSAVGDGARELLPTPVSRELAGNGSYEFGRAFRSNDLDYQTFYRTMAETDAVRQMRREFQQARSAAVFTNGGHPLERQVVMPDAPNPLNVVLVTIESLGADFVESFGGKAGLTPNLDRLAAEGLRFTKMYATGTRTVRGLEALALSVPPTPGHAVPVRKNNKGFQTLGGVLKDQGYDPLFIYGGYSYFDNMNDFFGGNGYTVIDRLALARSDISHETIWGVADEDLFKLVMREMDGRTAAGRKVFAHVLTTSNHRPYTYPEGRIDIPPKSGRPGAVKYTDWAIGNFMREAATRPWFKDTLFVFVADHTSRGRGRTDLPPENYHIPFIIYAPAVLQPKTIASMASLIDVGPTILGLLNVSYTSRFFGQDILTEGQGHQRALMGNYLTVGHMENGVLVELHTKRRARALDVSTGRELPAGDPRTAASIQEAIAYYQVADGVLRGRTPQEQASEFARASGPLLN